MLLHNYTIEAEEYVDDDYAIVYKKGSNKVLIMVEDGIYYISATTELLKEYFKKCIMEEIFSG